MHDINLDALGAPMRRTGCCWDVQIMNHTSSNAFSAFTDDPRQNDSTVDARTRGAVNLAQNFYRSPCWLCLGVPACPSGGHGSVARTQHTLEIRGHFGSSSEALLGGLFKTHRP